VNAGNSTVVITASDSRWKHNTRENRFCAAQLSQPFRFFSIALYGNEIWDRGTALRVSRATPHAVRYAVLVRRAPRAAARTVTLTNRLNHVVSWNELASIHAQPSSLMQMNEQSFYDYIMQQFI
jgi:hypothetical protein